MSKKYKKYLLVGIAFLPILLYIAYASAFGYLNIGAMILFIIALFALFTVSILLVKLEEETGPEAPIMYNCLVDVIFFAIIVYSTIVVLYNLSLHYQTTTLNYLDIPIIAISIILVKNSIVTLFSTGFNMLHSRKHSDKLNVIEAKQDSANNLILKFQENTSFHNTEMLNHLSGIIDVKNFTVSVEASLNQIPGQLSGIVKHLEVIEDTVGVRYSPKILEQIEAAGIDMRLKKWNREMANAYLKIMLNRSVDVLTLYKNKKVSGDIEKNKASYYTSYSVRKYVMGELESIGKTHLKGFEAEEVRKSDALLNKGNEESEDSKN